MAGKMIGQLAEFDPTSDSVLAYIEKAQLFLQANEIMVAKCVAVFLTTIVGRMYTLLQNILAPTLPKDKSFNEMVDALKKHSEPKVLVIAEQFKFHSQGQAVGESVAQYIAELST